MITNLMHDGKKIHIIKINHSFNFTEYDDLFNNSVVLLHNEYEDFSESFKNTIIEYILNNGCKYAVCSGSKCECLPDTIDNTHVSLNNSHNAKSTHVMTTWHDDEEMKEVIDVFLNNTGFNEIKPDNYIIVLLSEKDTLISKIIDIITNDKYK